MSKKRRVSMDIESFLEGGKSLYTRASVEKFLIDLENLIEDLDVMSADGQIAAYELALVRSQLGNHDEADRLFSQLGFRFKLSEKILCPRFTKDLCVTRSSSDFAAVYDSALPLDVYSKLLRAFCPKSRFWSDHSYPTPGFFSYNIPMDDPDHWLILQAAKKILPLAQTSFPHLFHHCEPVDSIEFWCHNRADSLSGGAHQLHFDMDEARLGELRKRGEIGSAEDTHLHPICSVVLYLGCGEHSAPTLITNQTLAPGSVASKGYLVKPEPNRLLIFDGRMLHGVVPYMPPFSSVTDECGRNPEPRITLMLGLWRKGVNVAKYSLANLQPNMRMPTASGTLKWPKLFKQGTSASATDTVVYRDGDVITPRLGVMYEVTGPVWVPIECPHDTNSMTNRSDNKVPSSSSSAAAAAVEFISLADLEKLRASDNKSNSSFSAGGCSSSTMRKKNRNKGGVPPRPIIDHIGIVEFVGRWVVKDLGEIFKETVMGRK